MAYVGEYRERLRDGQGTYVFPGGSFQYEGDWKRGKMHGHGVFSLSDGGSYEGEFVNGEIDGIGLRRWRDGSTYNGQFQRGERHGEGVHITSLGEVYEGHWVSNQRQGLGELRLANGDVYRGDFHHHKPHGNGRIKFAHDGRTYDGDWVDGKICGRGVLKDTQNAKLYDGEWFNGQRCGHGVGRVPSSMAGAMTDIVYDGVWANDKPLAPATKLGLKLMVPPPVEEGGDTSEAAAVVYQDVPVVLTLDKKLGFQLPRFAVVSLHEPSQPDSEPNVVAGESGRSLRLRVFEGPVPTPSDATQQPPPLASEDAGDPQPSAPAQWHFTVVPDPLPPTPENEKPVEAEAQVEPPSADPEQPEIEEPRLNEGLATNVAGVAVFEKLAMPSASLLGSYHIVCENLDNDDASIAPVYWALQLVE